MIVVKAHQFVEFKALHEAVIASRIEVELLEHFEQFGAHRHGQFFPMKRWGFEFDVQTGFATSRLIEALQETDFVL